MTNIVSFQSSKTKPLLYATLHIPRPRKEIFGKLSISTSKKKKKRKEIRNRNGEESWKSEVTRIVSVRFFNSFQ